MDLTRERNACGKQSQIEMNAGRIIEYTFHVRVQKDLSAELCLERKFRSYSGHGPVETTGQQQASVPGQQGR